LFINQNFPGKIIFKLPGPATVRQQAGYPKKKLRKKLPD
jgi:hypothetical protein